MGSLMILGILVLSGDLHWDELWRYQSQKAIGVNEEKVGGGTCLAGFLWGGIMEFGFIHCTYDSRHSLTQQYLGSLINKPKEPNFMLC